MPRERLHAEGLGGIVAAVKKIQPVLLSERVAPMRALAGDESIDAFRQRLRHFAARAAGHDADTAYSFGSSGAKVHLLTERLLESLLQLGAGNFGLQLEPDRLSFVGESGCALR